MGLFKMNLRLQCMASMYPSKIEWDLTTGPLRKLLELLDIYSGLGVRSVGPVGDFLEWPVHLSDPSGVPTAVLEN